MIEGIHTPTQEDSHAELQARNGWTVAAMRREIDERDGKINAFHDSLAQFIVITANLERENENLKQTLYNSLQFWSGQNQTMLERLSESEREKRELKQALEAKTRLVADYQIRVGNALQFLNCVSCGNMSEGFLRSAVSELKSVRRPDAP